MGRLAFVVLQSQTDASAVVADAIADACASTGRPPDLAERLRVLRRAARRIRRHVRPGDVQPLLPDPTEPPETYALRLGLMDLPIGDRLALALRHVAALDVSDIAAVIGASQTEVRERLNDAGNRVQALVERNGQLAKAPTSSADEIVDFLARDVAADAGATSPVRSPFNRVLGEHLRREALRYRSHVSVPDIEAARQRDRQARRGRLAVSVAGTLVAAAVVAGSVGVLTLSSAPPPGHVGRAPSASSEVPPTGPPGPVPQDGAPIGLADCQIAPADSSLAYAGWATIDVLHVQGGHASPGSPVYAVVTRGLAEWVGWQSTGGAMYPPPIGRMGCVYDPSTRLSSIVGVPMDWQPPAVTEGCPTSTVTGIGTYRETGGPSGWLVLPSGAANPSAGRHVHDPMAFRLSPPPNPGQTVSAWAQPIGGGAAVPADVSVNTTLQRPAAAIARSAGESGLYTVDLQFPTSGCWIVDMAINGNLVGSAVLTVDRAAGQPSPRLLPIVP